MRVVRLHPDLWLEANFCVACFFGNFPATNFPVDLLCQTQCANQSNSKRKIAHEYTRTNKNDTLASPCDFNDSFVVFMVDRVTKVSVRFYKYGIAKNSDFTHKFSAVFFKQKLYRLYETLTLK